MDTHSKRVSIHPIITNAMEITNIVASTTRAIPKFQLFCSHYISMCSTSSYAPYQWLYPGTYQPLQSICVLLTDLLRNTDSPEANKSREVVEGIFTLLSPEGRITVSGRRESTASRQVSNGARMSWIILDKLRKRVWRVMGLDATVMWGRNLGYPEVTGWWVENHGGFSTERRGYGSENSSEAQFTFPQAGQNNQFMTPGMNMPE
jgi:hypothetical protein